MNTTYTNTISLNKNAKEFIPRQKINIFYLQQKINSNEEYNKKLKKYITTHSFCEDPFYNDFHKIVIQTAFYVLYE